MECMYGISRTKVNDSVEYVRNSLISHPDFKIGFPSCHAKQRDIADGLRNFSKENINFFVD